MSSTRDVAVVTNVSVDHVEYLGPTTEEIAAEKAGIVKPGATLVLGETDEVVAGDLRGARPAARIVLRERDFGVRNNVLAVGGRYIDLYTPTAAYPDVFLAVARRAPGRQRGDRARRRRGVRRGVAPARGRRRGVRERRRRRAASRWCDRSPLVVLDGAHNVAGAEALRRSLDEEFGAVEARTLVVGFLREKDPVEMLAALGVDADRRAGRLLPGAEPAGPRPRGGGQGRARPRRAAPIAWRSPTGSPRR